MTQLFVIKMNTIVILHVYSHVNFNVNYIMYTCQQQIDNLQICFETFDTDSP